MTPLRSPTGAIPGFGYVGELFGVCPNCKTEAVFQSVSTSELGVGAAEGVLKRGGGSIKAGFFIAFFVDGFRLLMGSRIALRHRCKTCHKRFDVCRFCMCPNEVDLDRHHCDGCGNGVVL